MPKTTFKRAELHQLSGLLTAALEGSGSTLSFRPGQSDETVAQLISTKLNRTITPEEVRRVRHQVVGKLCTEGRPSAELMRDLLRMIQNQNKIIADLSARVTAIEDDMTEPEPQQENTAVVTRTGTTHRNGHYSR